MDEPGDLKRAVIVDFDGTLVNLPVDWSRLKRQIGELFLGNGIKANLTPLTSGIRDALEETPEPEALKSQVYAIFEQMERAALNSAEPIEGGGDLLVGLMAKDYKIIVFSANSSEVVHAGLAKFALPVDLVVGREGSNMIKADPQYLPFFRQRVADFTPAGFVGDSETDRIVAGHLSIPFFLVDGENKATYMSVLEQL